MNTAADLLGAAILLGETCCAPSDERLNRVLLTSLLMVREIGCEAYMIHMPGPFIVICLQDIMSLVGFEINLTS